MALEDRVNTANPGTDFADYGLDNNYWQNAYSWEPKKAHQFIMEIEGIPAYLIHSSAKPSLDNGEVVLEHMNVQRYVKGKSKWNSISISLYDPIVPSAAQSVMDWVRLHHESATGRDGYSSMYKKDLVCWPSPHISMDELFSAFATFLHKAAGAFSRPPSQVPFGPKIL